MKWGAQTLVALLTVVWLVACQDKSSPTQVQALDRTVETQAQSKAVARDQAVASVKRPGSVPVVARKETSASGLSGAYALSTAESCSGVTSREVVQVIQVGDQFSFLLGVDSGGVQGKIHGTTIDISWDDSIDGGLLCGSQLTGTATIKDGTISGSVFGVSNEHSCFRCPSDTITFTLARQQQP